MASDSTSTRVEGSLMACSSSLIGASKVGRPIGFSQRTVTGTSCAGVGNVGVSMGVSSQG